MIKIGRRIHRGESGITGLETAIILIAFIVVASVFAYTVLSAGLFSSQKADETVHSGISQSQSTMELRGSVLAYQGTVSGGDCVTKISTTVGNALVDGKEIDLTPPYYLEADGTLRSPTLHDCDSVWTDASGGNVTVSIDSADYREPPRSNKLVIGAAGASPLAYCDITNADLSSINQLTMWIKSSVALSSAGSLTLDLYDAIGGTGGAGALVEALSVPALQTNTWKKCTLTIAAPASASDVDSLELVTTVVTTNSATIYLDEIKAKFTDGNSVTLVTYSDSNVVIDECAWTVEFSGGYDDDGDYLLENAEKAIITVWLHNYNGTTGVWTNGSTGEPFIQSNTYHLGANDQFSLQIMPSVGSTILMEKRIPAYLNPVMRLN